MNRLIEALAMRRANVCRAIRACLFSEVSRVMAHDGGVWLSYI
jgi:hypothetical protein